MKNTKQSHINAVGLNVWNHRYIFENPAHPVVWDRESQLQFLKQGSLSYTKRGSLGYTLSLIAHS